MRVNVETREWRIGTELDRTQYIVTIDNAGEAEIVRAERILDAAVLAIEDKAPALFKGPPPLNTNASDIGNYTEGTR